MIKLIRIDYRLLHGQIVVSWLNRYNVDRIIIVDDKAGSSETEKSILNIAKPQGTRLNIFTVEEALARKNKISELNENVAIIFGNTQSCLDFMKEFKSDLFEINYGAIPKKENSKEFDKAVFLTDQDISNSKELIALGYKLYSQQTPSNSSIDLNKVL